MSATAALFFALYVTSDAMIRCLLHNKVNSFEELSCCSSGQDAVHGYAWNMRGCVRISPTEVQHCQFERLPWHALLISLNAGDVRYAAVIQICNFVSCLRLH